MHLVIISANPDWARRTGISLCNTVGRIKSFSFTANPAAAVDHLQTRSVVIIDLDSFNRLDWEAHIPHGRRVILFTQNPEVVLNSRAWRIVVRAEQLPAVVHLATIASTLTPTIGG